jgi:hypothetical protein
LQDVADPLDTKRMAGATERAVLTNAKHGSVDELSIGSACPADAVVEAAHLRTADLGIGG